MVKKVLVPLAPGCEELEAVTIIDLLRRAGIQVVTASLEEGPVTCSRGTVIVADTTLETIKNEEFDLIVLPGGLPGADHLNQDPRIHELISRTAAANRPVAAICAAPKVLASNGLLNGKKATAYPGSLDALDTSAIDLGDAPVVVDENIITSRGPGTAMDFALTLIEILLGKKTRDDVEGSLKRA